MSQPAMQAAATTSDALSGSARSKRILFVDDQEMILRLMARHFGRRGFEVETASSAAGAEEVLRRVPIDLLVADLGLSPGKPQEGFELVERARSIHPDIRALVLTGIAGADIDREAEARGVAAVLTKPQPLSTLEEVILGVLFEVAALPEAR